MRKRFYGVQLLARRTACLFTVAALLFTAGCGTGGEGGGEEKTDRSDLTGTERVKAEVEQVLDSLNKSGKGASLDSSIDMTISVELANGSYNGVDLNDYLRDTSIGLKLDAKGDWMGLAGDVVFMGDEVISGTLIYDNGVVGFKVPELDNTYYTIDINQLDEGREFLAMMDGMGSASVPTDDIMSVLGRYIDLVGETVTKENTTKEKGDFSFEKLDGGSSGTICVFAPSDKDVEDLLLRLANELEDDEELRDLVVDYAAQISEIMTYTPSAAEKSELKEELAESMREAADELRDVAQRAGREVEDADFQCTLCTGKNGAWKAELSFEDYGDTYRLCAERNDNGFAFWMDGDDESMEFVVRHETSGGSTSGTAALRVSDRYDSFDVELRFQNVTDKTSALGIPYGNYTLSIPNVGKLYLDVTGSGSGTDHVISMDIPSLATYCGRNGMPDLNGVRITLHTTDQSVSVPTPSGSSVDLTGMSSYEIENIFDSWEDNAQTILWDLAEKLDLPTGGYNYDDRYDYDDYGWDDDNYYGYNDYYSYY